MRVRPNEPRKLKWKEERELEGMEDAILEIETEIEEMETKLNDPEFYKKNAASAGEVGESLEVKRSEAKAMYDRWEELEAIRAAYDKATL
jgi:ATP-binding cassette subfamily F protein uup